MDTENIERLVRSYYTMRAACEIGKDSIRSLSLDKLTRKGINALSCFGDEYIAIQKVIDRIEGDVYEYEDECLVEAQRESIQADTLMIEDIITDNIPPKIKPIPEMPAFTEMDNIAKLAGYK